MSTSKWFKPSNGGSKEVEEIALLNANNSNATIGNNSADPKDQPQSSCTGVKKNLYFQCQQHCMSVVITIIALKLLWGHI